MTSKFTPDCRSFRSESDQMKEQKQTILKNNKIENRKKANWKIQKKKKREKNVNRTPVARGNLPRCCKKPTVCVCE